MAVSVPVSAQPRQWTLKECIDYALEHNISIKQRDLNCQQQEIEVSTARNSRLPDLNASAGENISFGRGLTAENTYTNTNTSSTSFSLGTSVPLFTGFRIPRTLELNRLNLEAATADLNDVNLIDPFHLQAYGETTVNYNRDIEIFPVLNAMFENIFGESPYKSPTDMGVNMAGNCIVDDEAVRRAAKQEIIRRYYIGLCERREGKVDQNVVYKLELLMRQAKLTKDDRPVVAAALEKARETGAPAAAIELADGRIVTGRTSDLLGCCSAMLLNALKTYAGIPDGVHLISPQVIAPIQQLKVGHLGSKNPRLHTDEILIALSMCAVNDEYADRAMKQLEKLKGCEMHTSVMLSQVDEHLLKKLGLNVTSEPEYQGQKLYRKK